MCPAEYNISSQMKPRSLVFRTFNFSYNERNFFKRCDLGQKLTSLKKKSFLDCLSLFNQKSFEYAEKKSIKF